MNIKQKKFVLHLRIFAKVYCLKKTWRWKNLQHKILNLGLKKFEKICNQNYHKTFLPFNQLYLQEMINISIVLKDSSAIK